MTIDANFKIGDHRKKFIRNLKSECQHSHMNCFLMSLEEAVELVIYTFQNANIGDIMVQKEPACTIGILAQAVSDIFDVESYVQEKLKIWRQMN